jgi:hypothetical protein
MKRCSICQLDFTGDLDRCPLCSNSLTGSASPAVFPENELARPKKIAKRCLIGLMLAGLLLVVLAGYATSSSPLAIGAGVAAVLVSYIFIRNVVVHSPSFLRMIERYFLVLIALALLCLLATGDRALATYLVPLVSFIALATNGVLVILFRNTFVQGYAKYLIYELALGLVPLVLMVFGFVTWPLPAIATTLAAVLLLVLMLALTRKQLVSELSKLFHA